MKTKVLSWIVTLALLLGMVPVFPAQTAQAADSNPWTNYAATSAPSTVVYCGKTCYAIGTAAQLAWFAKQVQNGSLLSANIVLTADIDLSDHLWTPIYRHNDTSFEDRASSHTAYTGSIYGDYHTISNLRLGALSVDYTLTEDEGYLMKASDKVHSDLYGFVMTTGSVQGLRINGVSMTKSTAGGGYLDNAHGEGLLVIDADDVCLIYVEKLASDIEIDNPNITAVLGLNDRVALVSTWIGTGTFSACTSTAARSRAPARAGRI